MSWSLRITASYTASPELAYHVPWHMTTENAVLMLHSDLADIYVGSIETDPIWYAGFLPADNAITKECACDLGSGGDWDQVRSTTVLIADQMRDETRMETFLASKGIQLRGARIEVFSGLPSGATPTPTAYWSGRIVSAEPADFALRLECEPDGDTDPVGTILDASLIRPMVFGSAANVPIAIIQDEETYPALTWTGYYPDTIVNHGRMPDLYGRRWDLMEFLLQTRRLPAVLAALLGQPIGANRVYLFANIPEGQDEYLTYFPAGIVTLRNWFLEVMSGNGKGMRRRLKFGDTVYTYHGVGDTPHVEITGDFDIFGSTLPQNRGQIIFPLEEVFCTSAGVWDSALLADPYPLGAAGERHESAKSYLRLVRKDFRITKPLYHSEFALKLKSGDEYIRYANNDKLFDEGDRILIVPQYGFEEKVRLFDLLKLDPSTDVVTQAYPPPLTGSVASVFSPEGGSVSFAAGSPQYLVLGIIPPDLRAQMENSVRLWLSIDASYAGILRVFARIQGRQQAVYALDPDITPTTEGVKVLPRTLGVEGEGNICYRDKSIPAAGGGVTLLMPWEPGYSEDGPNYLVDGIYVPMTSEIECVQHIEIEIHAPDASQPLVIRRLALYLERSADLSAFWGDITGPTYLSCPGGIDRDNGAGGVDNSFAIERNAHDGIALSPGLSSGMVIDDHAHVIEGILRVQGYHGAHIDVESIETAYWDSVTKTRISGFPESVDQRPKCSIALTDIGQEGDLFAQLCRDGGLAGGRDALGRRTLKAFLARTWLSEQDYELKDAYGSGPGDFVADSFEVSWTSLDDVVTSPLIRYRVEAGEPTRYIQVLHPEASTYDPSYCIGFEREVDAQRAWEICHKGWIRTGVIHAREIQMISVADYSSLIKLLMPQRGCGQLEWMVQQKRKASYRILNTNLASTAPDGSRMKLTHWQHAPDGAWGTVSTTAASITSGIASQSVILDPEP